LGRLQRFFQTFPEYGGVVTTRNLDDDRFAYAFSREVLVQSLPQHRSVYSYDVVCRRVIIARPPKHPVTHLLFMDLRTFILKHTVRQIEKEIA
jgi:hypothetical protein